MRSTSSRSVVRRRILRPLTACSIALCGASSGSHSPGDPSHVAAPPNGPPHCDSLPPASDTISYQVYAMLEAPVPYRYDDKGELQRDSIHLAFRQLVLQAIRQNFVAPQNPSVTTFVIRRDVGPPVATPTVFGEAMFSLTPTGGLADAELTQSSLSPTLNQSLMDALHWIDTAHAFPLPGDAGAKLTRLYVNLVSASRPSDSAALLFTIRVPVWHQWTYPTPDPAHWMPIPAYPPELQRMGFESTLVLEFVVNEDGGVEPSTIRLAHSKFAAPSSAQVTYVNGGVQLSDFVTAVLHSVRSARYLPGTVAGCAVKQLVQQPFVFKMRSN